VYDISARKIIARIQKLCINSCCSSYTSSEYVSLLSSGRSTCVRIKSSKQFSRKISFRQHRHSIYILRTNNREVRQIQWIGYSRMDLEHNAGWSKMSTSNKKFKQLIDWRFIIKQSSKFYCFCWTLRSFPNVSTRAVDPELKFRAPALGF